MTSLKGELHERIAASHPSLIRGQVWCTTCGHTFRFGYGEAQRRGGWPKCCGHTMTIDSPKERAAIAKASALTSLKD